MTLEYITEVNIEAFEEFKRKIPTPAGSPGKKFNIKIKSEDLLLIDYITDKENITRSSILNKAVDDIIKHELDSIEDFDAKLLIAKTADSYYDSGSEEPGRWTCWVLRGHIKELQENYLQWNHRQPFNDAPEDINSNNSDQFNFIKERIF